MKIDFTTGQKIFVALTCFAIAVIGFMVKLPSGFRHVDKELHAAFYFLAAALLNVFFARTNFIRHAIIFASLYFFGMAIEYAQAYSNRFYRSPIHGRFDPEDMQWNFKGLMAFSAVWIVLTLALLAYKRTTRQGDQYRSEKTQVD